MENHTGVLETLQGSGATLPISPNATRGSPSRVLPAPPVILETSPCAWDRGPAHVPELLLRGARLLTTAALPSLHTISVRYFSK